MGRSGDPLVVDGHIVRLPVKTNAAGEVRRGSAVTSTGLLGIPNQEDK
jgi:hypothetical protein